MPYSNVTFTVSQNLSYVAGDFVQLSYDADNYVIGTVVSYSDITGVMVITPIKSVGTGTYSIWNVSLTGNAGSSGTNGTSGTSASSGTSATSGDAGSSGTAGTSGSDGLSGSSGTAGTSGSSATAGTSGSAGTTGAIGPVGPQGAQGPTGATGSSGSSSQAQSLQPTGVITTNVTSSNSFNVWIRTPLDATYNNVLLDGTFYVHTVP